MATYVKDTRTGYQVKLDDAAGLIAAHEAASNPHPTYLTQAEGDALYADATHAHAISDVTGLQTELDNVNTAIEGRKPYLGVGNRDDLTLSYDAATRKFTITGAAEIWIQGVKTTLSNPYVFGAHADVTGGYFFYFDENGVETISTTPWNLETHAPIGFVFYNATLADGVPFYELHDARRDPMIHANLHHTVGTSIENGSGFTVSGYTLNSDLDASKTLAISSGTVWDEDISRTTTAVADGGPYAIMYRSGASGEWTWTKTATFPFLDDGTNIYYNEFTGATWQLTALTASPEYVNMWVFATTSLTGVFTVFFIVGQVKHASEGAAFAATLADINWGSVPFQEIAPLYQITFRRASSNANQGKADIRRVARLSGTRSTTATTGVAPTAAAAVSFTPYSTLSSTNVQAAIQELLDESGGAGASALDDLTDVTITAPATNEVLTYNGSAWVNAAATGGGGGTVTVTYEPVTLSAVSQSATYAGVTSATISNMTDGDGTTGTGTSNTGTQYVEVEWSGTKSIVGVQFGGGTIAVWGAVSAYLNGRTVQYWDGSAWVNWFVIPSSTYADSGDYQFVKIMPDTLPVSTTKLRLTQSSGYVATTEFIPYALVVGGSGVGNAFTVSATAPSSPNNGDRWVDTDTGILYTWYDDGVTATWAEL